MSTLTFLPLTEGITLQNHAAWTAAQIEQSCSAINACECKIVFGHGKPQKIPQKWCSEFILQCEPVLCTNSLIQLIPKSNIYGYIEFADW